ncbi:MAG: lysostaphin resistance A-like protein [Candidatus Rokuibacteriota bacterium]
MGEPPPGPRLTPSGSVTAPPPVAPPRLWPLFAAYVVAFAGIVALSIMAAGVLRGLYPDTPDRALFEGLPGLLAGGIASSTALVLTTFVFNRPFEPLLLRLTPGWETGRMLFVMIAGMLALGQALDSLTLLVGLGQRGAMVAIRRALAGAVGPELFLAVVVIGVLAGSAEEVFFRGYMQTRLGQRLRPGAAVLVTSVAFGLLHLEWMHAVLAFALGLYLGWITELAGSALPAVTCHVINNALFTVLTALLGTVEAPGPNVVLLLACGAAFAGCVAWLRRARNRL